MFHLDSELDEQRNRPYITNRVCQSTHLKVLFIYIIGKERTVDCHTLLKGCLFLSPEQPSDEDQPVIVAGGGGILLNPDNPLQFKGASKVIIPKHFQVILASFR